MDTTRFLPLYDLPAHLIRRSHQAAVAAFQAELGGSAITPTQLAVLLVVNLQEGLEQRQIAEAAGLDQPTVGGVLGRLESAGLIKRHRSHHSRRGRAVYLSDEGRKMMRRVIQPAVARIQKRLVRALTKNEQAELSRLLSKMVRLHNSYNP
jgi:DNA-binding MarR family transcriptional regulator